MVYKVQAGTEVVLEACNLILKNSEATALEWCVNYAKHCKKMVIAGDPIKDIKVQALYVLDNMNSWRGTDATRARACLRTFIK